MPGSSRRHSPARLREQDFGPRFERASLRRVGAGLAEVATGNCEVLRAAQCCAGPYGRRRCGVKSTEEVFVLYAHTVF